MTSFLRRVTALFHYFSQNRMLATWRVKRSGVEERKNSQWCSLPCSVWQLGREPYKEESRSRCSATYSMRNILQSRPLVSHNTYMYLYVCYHTPHDAQSQIPSTAWPGLHEAHYFTTGDVISLELYTDETDRVK